jgi:hypothetical protein
MLNASKLEISDCSHLVQKKLHWQDTTVGLNVLEKKINSLKKIYRYSKKRKTISLLLSLHKHFT